MNTNCNSNRRAFVTTLVVLVVCLVIVTGSTFSLFTSQSGTNIAITSGKVEMVATINAGSLKLYSKDAEQTGKFENGGTAGFNAKNTELTLTNVTPGDKVTFEIDVVNNSNVDIQYRVNWVVDGELAEALVASVDGVALAGGTSEWVKWIPSDPEEKTLAVAIELPLTAGNSYQNKTVSIAFNVEAVQANATAEHSPVAYISTPEGFKAAIKAGCTRFVFNDDVTLDTETVVEIPAGVTVTVDMKGNKLVTNNPGKAFISNYGTLIINGDEDSVISNAATNGKSVIYNEGELVINGGTYQGAPSDIQTGNASYVINSYGAGSTVEINDANLIGRGSIGITNGGKGVINGGLYHTPTIAWGHAVYVSGAGSEVVINGGTFSEGYDYQSDAWGMYQIYAGDGASAIVNGGNFLPWDCANGYDLCTGGTGTISITGGTFADDPSNQNGKNFVAAGYGVLKNTDGTYTVYANNADTIMTLKSGAVLDLGDIEFLGKVVAEGDLTIKGDAKIKTLTAVNGGTITVEKTLTLNNFSFGSKDTAGSEYTITGGTITANYGFFQHGVYDLHSNFETGYMYYSYGSDITVYGTFHSQGKGDGLDYIRGKLTIAEGGKSIHDKSLWVGQPAGWGAMSASLTVEKGGYVQANSLSVYEGSVAYNDVANVGVEGVGVKYNTLSGKINAIASDVTGLVAAINAAEDGATIYLTAGDYALGFTNHITFNVDNLTIKGMGDVNLAISSTEAWYGRVQGSNVTFENIHFTSSVGATGKATYNNCIFDSWAICASSNKEETYYNNCTINGCLNTSTDFSSGDVYVKDCKIAKAEYSGSMTMYFENCQIEEVIIWNSNTYFTNCDITTLHENVTTATVIKK